MLGVGAPFALGALPLALAFCTFVFVVLAARILAETLCWDDRFAHELACARAELAILGTAAERDSYVSKWWLTICRRERRIKREFAQRMAQTGWIKYLRHRAAEGGADVLRWYHSEMDLLAMAKSLDATTSFSEYQEARARESLRLAGITLRGEEELALEREQLRTQREPALPWESLL